MNAEELLKKMFRSFFMIATGIVVSMYLFCLILYPDVTFTLQDIGRILLMAVLSDLPLLIFYSGNELSKKQMYIRKSVHLLALLAVTLYCANTWNWISIKSAKEVSVFLMLVLLVYIIVLGVTTYNDKKLADKMNRYLKERYRP